MTVLLIFVAVFGAFALGWHTQKAMRSTRSFADTLEAIIAADGPPPFPRQPAPSCPVCGERGVNITQFGDRKFWWLCGEGHRYPS